MQNFYPLILGIMDTLNDWNDKLNALAADKLDNVWVGTLILGILIVVAFFGVQTLNKKQIRNNKNSKYTIIYYFFCNSLFEKNQKIQICREREQQKRQPRRSVPPVHHACKGIVNEDRRTEQQRVARARATEVKREAAQHENRIFQRTGDEIVDRQKKRQKIKQEGQISKAHGKNAPVGKGWISAILHEAHGLRQWKDPEKTRRCRAG